MYTKTELFDQRLWATATKRYNNGSGLVVTNPQGWYGPFRSGVKTGSSVPNWRKLIKSSLDATSDYSRTAYRLEKGGRISSSFTAGWPSNPALEWSETFSGIPGANQVFQTLVSPNEAKALSKIYQKIKATRSEMNGLQFFGELKETVHMLRHPADALVKGFFNYTNKINNLVIKNPKIRHARNRQNLVDTVSGLWLEAQYGWRPWISEIQDISRTVGRIVIDSNRKIDRVAAFSSAEGVSISSLANTMEQGLKMVSSTSQWERRYSTTSSVHYIAFLDHTVTGPTTVFEKVAQISGLTFENIVPTIYELIPYSFLLDYASNLGQCIEASFTDISAYKFGLKINRTVDAVEVISTPSESGIRSSIVGSGWYVKSIATSGKGYYKETRTTLVRQRLTSLPLPRFEFSLTSSPLHIGNVIALLAGSQKTSQSLRL